MDRQVPLHSGPTWSHLGQPRHPPQPHFVGHGCALPSQKPLQGGWAAEHVGQCLQPVQPHLVCQGCVFTPQKAVQGGGDGVGGDGVGGDLDGATEHSVQAPHPFHLQIISHVLLCLLQWALHNVGGGEGGRRGGV